MANLRTRLARALFAISTTTTPMTPLEQKLERLEIADRCYADARDLARNLDALLLLLDHTPERIVALRCALQDFIDPVR